MVSFQVERWSEFWPEGVKHFPAHYDELSLDKGKFKLAPFWERYAELDNAGVVVVFTARVEGELVGYLCMMILPHLHYASAGNMAHTDMYFVAQEHRKGGLGARLFLFAQSELKKRGCVKMYTSCKVHQDHSAMFKALGFTLSDYFFTKALV